MMTIKPYASVGGVAFGGAESECIDRLGFPLATHLNREGFVEMVYAQMIVRLDPIERRVVEFTLLPNCKSKIEGIEITWDRRFLERACHFDGKPREVYGFVVLPNLGIAITGIHDDDVSQMAITVFNRGAFDDLLVFGVPYLVD
ncbi:MAG: hypothetical protein ACK6D3_08450 [Planctomycetaceae bacterium]